MGRASSPIPHLDLASAILPATLFGLFTFILMSTGIFSDAVLADGEVDVPLYNMRETMLLAGFVVYGLISWNKPRALTAMAARGFRLLLAAVYVCCMLVLLLAPGGAFIAPAVAIMALAVGFSGGFAFEATAYIASSRSDAMRLPGEELGGWSRRDKSARMLGPIVGVGGGLAVLAQYLLQLQLPLGGWFGVLLAACFCFYAYLAGPASRECLEIRAHVAAGGGTIGSKQVLCLIAAVFCLFMLFPFYEVTIRDVFPWAVFLQWHRLLGIVGYLIVGAAAFFGGRRAASMAVVIAALFTVFVLTETALFQVGDFTMALFFMLYSMIVAYSAIAFMTIAPQTAHPSVVASMSRVLGEALTLAEGAIVALAEWSPSTILFAALVLVALTMLLLVFGGFFTPLARGETQGDNRQPEGETTTGKGKLPADAVESASGAGEPSPDAGEVPLNARQIDAIAKHYGLTRRETEVLELVLRDFTAQQIADELIVAKSTAKFHVTNILKKTGSETRRELIEKLSDEATRESEPR